MHARVPVGGGMVTTQGPMVSERTLPQEARVWRGVEVACCVHVMSWWYADTIDDDRCGVRRGQEDSMVVCVVCKVEEGVGGMTAGAVRYRTLQSIRCA